MDLEERQGQDCEARIVSKCGDLRKCKTRTYLMKEKAHPNVRFATNLVCDKDSAENMETPPRIHSDFKLENINFIPSEVVELAGADLRCQSSLSQCVSVISCNSTQRLKSALKSQGRRQEKYVKTTDTNNAEVHSWRTETEVSTSKLPELNKKRTSATKTHNCNRQGVRTHKYSYSREPAGKVPRTPTANRVSVAGRSVEATLNGVHYLRPFLPLLTLTQYSDVDSAVIEVVREFNDNSQGAINTMQSYL